MTLPAPEGVTFKAIFSKAQTTPDGGWNLTFSVSDDEAKQVMQVSQLRDTVLQLAVIPIEAKEEY